MTTTSAPPISTADAPQAATLAKIFRFLQVVRMRKGILFASLFVAVVLAGLYYSTAPRLYESKARLYVLQTGSNVLEQAIEQQTGVRENMANYQGVLTSDVVLEEVLQKLPAKHRIDLKGIPRDKWIAALRNNLSVTAPRRTNLIDVRFRSRDPQVAAAVVNHLVQSYLKLMREIHRSTAGEDIEFLTAERKRLDEETGVITAELLSLKKQMQIVSGPDNQSINPAAERLAELNKALIEAMNRTREADATRRAIEEAAARGEDIQQFALTQIEAVGKAFFLKGVGLDPQDSWLTMRTRQLLLNDQVELRNRSNDLGPNHPKIQDLRARIIDRQRWLIEQPQRAAEQMRLLSSRQLTPMLIDMARQKLRYAVLREQALLEAFQRENQVVLGYEDQMSRIKQLNFELAGKREVARVVLDRLSRTDIGKERGGLRTKIVSNPKVAKSPVSPRLLLVALCALVGGLGGGLSLVYVLDVFDDRFRSPEELKIQLDAGVLAIVGEMPAAEDLRGLQAVRVHAEPNGSETEAFRTLRTSLTFSSEQTRQLVATSTEPGDGKTTVVANLAVAFAQSGKKTLLIDADMRRPGLTSLLDLRGPRGLSTVLRSEESIIHITSTNVFSTDLDTLDVIPAGPRPLNPAELLHGDRFSELLAWAASVYDQVLIDAPPALAVSDAAIIGRQVDGVLLVVRPDTNRRRMVIRAAESIRGVDAHLAGIVINHVTSDSGGDYYGYGYGHGYADDDEEADGADALTRAA